MNRRAFLLTTASAGTVALAGCSTTDEPTTQAQAVTDHTFTTTAADDTPDDPEIKRVVESDVGGTISVHGTATVADGCTTIAVGAKPVFMQIEDSQVIQTMIGTRETDADGCTQALRDIGYQLDIEYSGDPPKSIELAQAGQDSASHSLPLE